MSEHNLARALRRLMDVMPQDVLVDNEDEVNEAWADAVSALKCYEEGIGPQDIADTMPPRQGYEGVR